MEPLSDAGPRPLVMRSRVVHGERGTTVVQLVQCPKIDKLRSVSDCTACAGYCGGSFKVANGKPEARLLCRWNAAEGNPPACADDVPVGELMSNEVHCVQAGVTVAAALTILMEKNISGLPVVDADGTAQGILSKTDLVRPMYEAGEQVAPQTAVSRVMSPIAFTLKEDASLGKAASLMVVEGVHRIPIVSDDNKVIGIISALDIVRWLARKQDETTSK